MPGGHFQRIFRPILGLFRLVLDVFSLHFSCSCEDVETGQELKLIRPAKSQSRLAFLLNLCDSQHNSLLQWYKIGQVVSYLAILDTSLHSMGGDGCDGAGHCAAGLHGGTLGLWRVAETALRTSSGPV